jgi:polyhydroxyalkanoate synthase subunit PhaC
MLHPLRSGSSLITAAAYLPACSHGSTLAKHGRSSPSSSARFSWRMEGPALEVASALAPEQGLLADIDPALSGQAMATASLRAVRDPVGGTTLGLRLAADLISTGFAAWDRLLGGSASGPVTLDPKDCRFADPAWRDNPAFFAVRQAHLAWREYVFGLLTLSKPDPVTDGEARLALSVVADALASTNFLPTNPAALRRAFETGGISVLRGAATSSTTWCTTADFPGRSTGPRSRSAVTWRPRRVKWCSEATLSRCCSTRRRLRRCTRFRCCAAAAVDQQVLRDGPRSRTQLHRVGGPARSTVFAISYRNPDASMASTTMDDYLIRGRPWTWSAASPDRTPSTSSGCASVVP